jgi:hypothetical protein
MYRITSNGLTKDSKPYELIAYSNPLISTIVDFEKMLLKRGFEFPQDFISKNEPNKIIFEYSFLEANEFKENVQIVFKVEKIHD